MTLQSTAGLEGIAIFFGCIILETWCQGNSHPNVNKNETLNYTNGKIWKVRLISQTYVCVYNLTKVFFDTLTMVTNQNIVLQLSNELFFLIYKKE